MTNKYSKRLIEQAEQFCVANGCTEEQLARVVAKDSKFFKRVRSGRTFTVKMLERFEDHFNTFVS